MKIGFDIDGVLAQTNEEFFNKLNNHFNTTFKVEELTEWNMIPYVNSQLPDMTNNQLWKIYDNWIDENGLGISLYPHARRTVERLANDNHLIYLLTARQEQNQSETWAWYKHNFANVTLGLFFDHNKGKEGNRLGLDVMVEDSPGNVVDLFNHGITPIVIDKPYNQHTAVGVRVDNIKDVYGVIQQLNNNI